MVGDTHPKRVRGVTSAQLHSLSFSFSSLSFPPSLVSTRERLQTSATLRRPHVRTHSPSPGPRPDVLGCSSKRTKLSKRWACQFDVKPTPFKSPLYIPAVQPLLVWPERARQSTYPGSRKSGYDAINIVCIRQCTFQVRGITPDAVQRAMSKLCVAAPHRGQGPACLLYPSVPQRPVLSVNLRQPDCNPPALLRCTRFASSQVASKVTTL